MPTLLFLTDRSERHQQAAREAAPPEIERIDFLRAPSRAEILAAIPDADFLISERAGVIDREVISAGKRLRLIQRLGSLTHDIDLDAATAAGVPVCDFPLPGAVNVAEHLIWQILALLRRAHDGEAAILLPAVGVLSRRTDENVFATNWSKRRGIRSLSGLTVGILGFGEIGVEAVRRLRAFGCRMLYNKRSRLPEQVEKLLGIGRRTNFIGRATFYAICCPTVRPRMDCSTTLSLPECGPTAIWSTAAAAVSSTRRRWRRPSSPVIWPARRWTHSNGSRSGPTIPCWRWPEIPMRMSS